MMNVILYSFLAKKILCLVCTCNEVLRHCTAFLINETEPLSEKFIHGSKKIAI